MSKLTTTTTTTTAPALLPSTEQLATIATDGVHAYLANTKHEIYYTAQRKLSAMRVGLALVLISQEHGAFKTFAESVKDVEGMSERTLRNFKGIATAFLQDMKLLEKKKLGAQGAEQLELWTRESESLEAKALEWIGERSLNEVYEDLAAKAARIGGHQSPGADHSEEAERERAIAEASERFNEFQQWVNTDGCAHIDETAGRRLLPHEAAEKGMAFTVGLLSDEHLEAALSFAGNFLATVEHHQMQRAGVTKAKRRK